MNPRFLLNKRPIEWTDDMNRKAQPLSNWKLINEFVFDRSYEHLSKTNSNNLKNISTIPWSEEEEVYNSQSRAIGRAPSSCSKSWHISTASKAPDEQLGGRLSQWLGRRRSSSILIACHAVFFHIAPHSLLHHLQQSIQQLWMSPKWNARFGRKRQKFMTNKTITFS